MGATGSARHATGRRPRACATACGSRTLLGLGTPRKGAAGILRKRPGRARTRLRRRREGGLAVVRALRQAPQDHGKVIPVARHAREDAIHDRAAAGTVYRISSVRRFMRAAGLSPMVTRLPPPLGARAARGARARRAPRRPGARLPARPRRVDGRAGADTRAKCGAAARRVRDAPARYVVKVKHEPNAGGCPASPGRSCALWARHSARRRPRRLPRYMEPHLARAPCRRLGVERDRAALGGRGRQPGWRVCGSCPPLAPAGAPGPASRARAAPCRRRGARAGIIYSTAARPRHHGQGVVPRALPRRGRQGGPARASRPSCTTARCPTPSRPRRTTTSASATLTTRTRPSPAWTSSSGLPAGTLSTYP